MLEESMQTEGPYTMTEEILRKRLQKENRGRYSTQLYAAITGNFKYPVVQAIGT